MTLVLMPVSVFNSVMVAPGTAELLGSVTVPSVELVNCPQLVETLKLAASNSTAQRTELFFDLVVITPLVLQRGICAIRSSAWMSESRVKSDSLGTPNPAHV